MAREPDNRMMQFLGWSSAACWLLAWFLPVVDGYRGWAAFRTALGSTISRGIPGTGR